MFRSFRRVPHGVLHCYKGKMMWDGFWPSLGAFIWIVLDGMTCIQKSKTCFFHDYASVWMLMSRINGVAPTTWNINNYFRVGSCFLGCECGHFCLRERVLMMRCMLPKILNVHFRTNYQIFTPKMMTWIGMTSFFRSFMGFEWVIGPDDPETCSFVWWMLVVQTQLLVSKIISGKNLKQNRMLNPDWYTPRVNQSESSLVTSRVQSIGNYPQECS